MEGSALDEKAKISGKHLKGKEEKELKDCIYTNEDLDIDAEIRLDDLRRTDIESAIKRLDIWDTEHLIEKGPNTMNLFKTFVENNFGNLKERWANNRKIDKSLIRGDTYRTINNSQNKILNQNGKKQEDKISTSKLVTEHDDNHDIYHDFLDGEEKDMICILLQNINIFRKKFDFNIFIKNSEDKKIENLNNFTANNTLCQEEHKNLTNGLLENSNLKNENEKSFKLITRNAYSSFNLNNNSDKEFEMNNKTKINSGNFPHFNTGVNKKNPIINNKNNLNLNPFTNDTHSNLLWKTAEKEINNTNTLQTFYLQTEKIFVENKKDLVDNTNKKILINENYDEKINNIYHTKDKRFKTQDNFFQLKNSHFYYENANLTSESKNVFTNITKENCDNNYFKFESMSNINNNKLKDKFKIPYETKIGNPLDTLANMKNDNYKNKDYFKSLANFKKNLEVSKSIIFLNDGSVLNTKPNEKEKSSKIYFSNFNAFSILNNNINNTTRLATSHDTRKPNYKLSNNEINSNDKLIIVNSGYRKNSAKNNSSYSNLISENSSIKNLNRFNLLKNKTIKNKNKIDEIGEKIILSEANIANSMVGKDGNLKFYLSLMDKYLKFKDNKAFENLDSVDNYKKVIKEKIEKENIIRKE